MTSLRGVVGYRAGLIHRYDSAKLGYPEVTSSILVGGNPFCFIIFPF